MCSVIAQSVGVSQVLYLDVGGLQEQLRQHSIMPFLDAVRESAAESPAAAVKRPTETDDLMVEIESATPLRVR